MRDSRIKVVLHFLKCVLVFVPTIFSSCSQSLEPPDLGGLYNQPAQYHGAERNPVIVIPGVLGSKLRDQDSGRLVWGAFGGDYADPSVAEDIRLISLPMKENRALVDLRDSVVQDGALDRVRFSLWGLPLELRAYASILGSLGVGGYRDQQLAQAGAVDYGSDHYTCFQFAYDWRRDLVESAKQLHEYILKKKAYVEKEYEKRNNKKLSNLKFDIVAHSMGGLVARYYLRYGPHDLPEDGSLPELNWFGAKHIDKLVLVGTPSAGAVDSLITLIDGLPIPLHADYPSAILGTLPAVYQLMPRPRHAHVVDIKTPNGPGVDLYNPFVWKHLEWGLMNPKQDWVLRAMLPQVEDAAERRKIAFEHLQKILRRAKRFHHAIDLPAASPKTLSLYLIAGDAVPTKHKMLVDMTRGSFDIAETLPGDGTVLRSSALMDERVGAKWEPRLHTPIAWSHVTFLFEDHLGLTNSPVFVDNILYLLLEKPGG